MNANHKTYEAGADAMLQVLKKEKVSVNGRCPFCDKSLFATERGIYGFCDWHGYIKISTG